MEPIRLSADPVSAWREQLRRALDGEQIHPAELVARPPIVDGVKLVCERRHADGSRKEGIVIDGWTDVDDEGDMVRRWRVVQPYRGQIRYHVIAEDEILDEEYTGEIRVDVLRGLEGRLRRAVADDQGDDRHLAALNVIVRLLKNGGES